MSDNNLGAPAGYEPMAGGNTPPPPTVPPPTAIPAAQPRHSAGPGKTMVSAQVKAPTERPGELNDNDLEDIRKMAVEYGFERPERNEDGSDGAPAQDDGNSGEPRADAGENQEEPDGTDGSGDVDGQQPETNTDEPEVISVAEDEAKSIIFKVKNRDGQDENVSLETLLAERVPRDQFVQYKTQVNQAIKSAKDREREAMETTQQYRGFIEDAMVPHEFIAKYVANHVKNGNMSQAHAEAIIASFNDSDFGYKANEVKSRAVSFIENVRAQEAQEQESQQKRVARVRGDMVTIKDKYNGGKWLTDDQIDRLQAKMEQMRVERGYDFVAPLEAFLIYRDEVMGKAQPGNVRQIGQSRQAIIKNLNKKRSSAPAPGSHDSNSKGGDTLAKLAAEAEQEIRRTIRR